MDMYMEMPALLRKLENKPLSDRELGRYFDTKSPDDLLLTLRRLRRDGLFQFEVMLRNEYYVREQAHRDVLLRSDVLIPYDPFGALQRDTYGISVKSDTPLSEKEIIDVIRKLPPDMAERYLQFKLSAISKELYDHIAPQLKQHSGDEDDFYDRVEYNGLVADGAEITYKGEPVSMGFQHRQVVRLLIEKQGKLCTMDEFTDNPDIFTRDAYSNIDTTLRKLIAGVRKELKAVVGINCIKNTPSEGWYLALDL